MLVRCTKPVVCFSVHMLVTLPTGKWQKERESEYLKVPAVCYIRTLLSSMYKDIYLIPSRLSVTRLKRPKVTIVIFLYIRSGS